MELKINDEQLKVSLHEALLLSIPQEAREEMVRQAIADLVTPKKTSVYSNDVGKSEIQKAYENALTQAIGEMVRDDIRDNPQIKEDVLKAIEPYKYQDYDRQRVILKAIVEALLDYHSQG